MLYRLGYCSKLPVFPGCHRHSIPILQRQKEPSRCNPDGRSRIRPDDGGLVQFQECAERNHEPKSTGAGDGNRTRVVCLEGRCSAIELHRQMCPGCPLQQHPRTSRLFRAVKKERKMICAGPQRRWWERTGLEPATHISVPSLQSHVAGLSRLSANKRERCR